VYIKNTFKLFLMKMKMLLQLIVVLDVGDAERGTAAPIAAATYSHILTVRFNYFNFLWFGSLA